MKETLEKSEVEKLMTAERKKRERRHNNLLHYDGT